MLHGAFPDVYHPRDSSDVRWKRTTHPGRSLCSYVRDRLEVLPVSGILSVVSLHPRINSRVMAHVHGGLALKKKGGGGEKEGKRKALRIDAFMLG